MAILKDTTLFGDLVVTGKIEGYVRGEDIAAILHFSGVVDYANELPVDGSEKRGAVYIVKYKGSSGQEAMNAEYVCIAADTATSLSDWERLGDVEALDNYYTKLEVDQKIADEAGIRENADESLSNRVTSNESSISVFNSSESTPGSIRYIFKSYINDLDVPEISGAYLTAVSQMDGVISASAISTPGEVRADETKLVTGGAVYNAIQDLDYSYTGVGDYVTDVSEINGIISVNKGSFGSVISGNTAPVTGGTVFNAIKDKVDASNYSSKGDILYAAADATLGVLNIGSTDDVLVVNNGVPSWANKAPKASFADSATNAGTASKLSSNSVGSISAPVYFSNGVPSECNTFDSSSPNIDSIVLSKSGVTYVGSKINSNIDSTHSIILESSLKDLAGEGINTPTLEVKYGSSGADLSAGRVFNAVWNDLADSIEVDCEVEPGYCYSFNGKNYLKTDKYADNNFIGIHSDTAGFIIGQKGKGIELKVAVAGFVLAHVDDTYKPGTPLTTTRSGYLTKANIFTRIFHPERVIATFWKNETEKYWGPENNKIEVRNRKWIKIR